MAEFAAIIPPGEDLIPSTWQVDAARVVVAGRAADAADLRTLLGMLGLIEETEPDPEPEAEAPQPPRSGPAPTATCGTPAGYNLHRRRREAICEPCRAAERDRYRRRTAAKRTA